MADIEWGKVIKEKDIEGRCKTLLDDMESEVDGIIQETIREITSELKYVSVDSVERSFLNPALVDAKRIVSWTSLIVGGGGTVAADIANHNIDTVDLGVPVLSMHAPMEVISKADLYETHKAFCAFCK
jgi:aspartyl aminopeptidase